MNIGIFPEINAGLNSLSTLFLVAGWVFISRRMKRAHIVCMISALITSAVFLACYSYYHFTFGSIKFTAEGPIRIVYYLILIPHILLAMVIVPLVLATIVPAIRQRWEKHKRIARWTLPLWLFVSVTGVLVYLMLYQWFPSDELYKLGR